MEREEGRPPERRGHGSPDGPRAVADREQMAEACHTIQEHRILSGKNIQMTLFTEIYTPPFPSLFCVLMTSP
jgi:hypothetical protein